MTLQMDQQWCLSSVDLIPSKSAECGKETHKAVRDSIVVNHPGASEGLKELLLKSLYHNTHHARDKSRKFMLVGSRATQWLLTHNWGCSFLSDSAAIQLIDCLPSSCKKRKQRVCQQPVMDLPPYDIITYSSLMLVRLLMLDGTGPPKALLSSRLFEEEESMWDQDSNPSSGR